MRHQGKVITLLIILLLVLPISAHATSETRPNVLFQSPSGNIEYGLAANYTEDVGIKNHPSVILSSSFENSDWLTTDFNYSGWTTNYGYQTTNPDFVLTGNGALEYQSIENEHYPFVYKVPFEGQDVIFLRWYRRYETNYDFSCQSKTNGVYARATDGSSTPAGTVPTGYDKFSTKLQVWREWEGNRFEPKFYTYHPEQESIYGDSLKQNVGDLLFLETDRWYSFEIMLKANDVGQSNGEIKLWIDGVLKGHYTNMHFRDTNELKINELNITAYVGGSCTAPQDQKVWDDNLVLATEYIGPMVPSQDNSIIIDNSDSGFSTSPLTLDTSSISGSSDPWQEYTQADGQHYGGTHYYDADAGTGQDTATWSFTIPEPGLYEVYAWWWANDYRPADVPYTINSAGESETVRVSQQQNGGQWNSLGTYYFDGDGSVVISDDVTSGRDIVADAIRLVFQPTAEPSGTYLTIQTDQQEIYPGDPVTVNVAVNNAEELYGLQVACDVDPTIFTWTGAQFDDFFTDPILGAKNLDATAGTWTGAISQKNPAPALSGDGAFATFTFEAAAVGSAAINCDPLASDRDGVELPITVSSKTITVLDPSGSTTPETGIDYGVVQGKATYQGRSEHTGIEIKTIGPSSQNIQTDSTGEFVVGDLPSSDYGITADAELHLPACTTSNVTDGQVITLNPATLAGGDLDDNNEIRINDATLVGSNFGLNSTTSPTMNPLADINVDGEVNVKDLSILGGNFGKTGCQEWTTDPDTSS